MVAPYLELSLYGNNISKPDLQKSFFEAVELGVQGVLVPASYVPFINQWILEGITLSCPIDYPNGMSDIRLRNHAVLSAIRQGANAIDLVANSSLIHNGQIKKFIDDLTSNYEICHTRSVSLRMMVEYRHTSPKHILYMCDVARSVGIEYVLPSTGMYADDFVDNLLAGMDIRKHSRLSVISNGNIQTKEEYAIAQDSNVFGMRFNHIKAVERVFGV